VSSELSEIGLSVKRLQMRHHRAANAALAPHRISLVQWDALRHLHRNPDASLHHLAQLTFQTDQSFGELAARMIERGLIERVPGPGRAVRHRLTAEGERLRTQGQQVMDRVLADSFRPLDDKELATFGDLLARLLAERG
jgi:DNA-binding MarR family transcriptional regulator